MIVTKSFCTEKEAKNQIELENVKGKIDIENISFTYEDENEVFKDLSLSIDAGKTIALVGPSGGWKTTIESLPEGYDTYIGERGVRLSGGQKQRVSIDRIFLKNPPIIILDEATSALDNVTEREIQASLDELSKDRTNLVVAHRLSTIKNVDEIVVISQEGISERGTHRELINKNGVYSKLHSK